MSRFMPSSNCKENASLALQTTMLTPQQQLAVKTIAAAAILCEKTTGCPAELSTAQCIFESAYLTRAPGNNCFGIKVDQHGSGTQYILTHEYINGQWVNEPLAFEQYDTLADCFNDHARLIQTGVYSQAWINYSANHNLDMYVAGVATHYATDPNYYKLIDAEVHSSTVQQALAIARAEAAH